jgi:hypothetical protein
MDVRGDRRVTGTAQGERGRLGGIWKRFQGERGRLGGIWKRFQGERDRLGGIWGGQDAKGVSFQ